MALTKNSNDHEIITLIQKNNSSEFSLIYDKYAPLLYGIIYRMVKNREIAEELLEITFIKIFKEIKSYNPDKLTFFIWMMGIALKLAKFKIPEGSTIKIEDMNEPSQDVFQLIISKGLSITEAAVRMNISRNEAMKKLRKSLKFT